MRGQTQRMAGVITRLRLRGARTSSVFTVRRSAALGVAAVATEAVLSAASPADPRRLRLIADFTPQGLRSLAPVLVVLVAVALVVLTPRLWRGARTAASLAIAGLLLLVLLNLLKGVEYAAAVPELCLAVLLVAARAAFPLGCSNRPRLAPVRAAEGLNHGTEHELSAVRAIVERHGEDSISPFILRPDKDFHFGGGGVLAYRLFGETAVVSGDPVGPDESVRPLMASFLQLARGHGWHVVVWGSSASHLAGYQSMGLRALCVGEEAVVDPASFSLEGRSVRKLRQSTHRVERRGWLISACEGREIDAELESEIDAVELAWRSAQGHLLGFAMGMGAFEPGVQPNDLYMLARSPEGELRGVMRFIAHRGRLSLDTMRRVGETPNGLNEALVCRALEVARERGVAEVSLNYAGLGHLVRGEPRGNLATRLLTRCALGLLGRRFQMERLVRFNEKFSPDWRPRFLIYKSRLGLPQAVFRILQAEGYVPQRERGRLSAGWRRAPRALPSLPHAEGPGVREVR
jgi:lysylphosphatidylglycerol synthetase-like protein (DUF2156 family)